VPSFDFERNKSSSVNSGVPTFFPEQSPRNESLSLDPRAPVFVSEQFSGIQIAEPSSECLHIGT